MAKVRGFKRRLEPFGATQKRGREFAAVRKLNNRIAELESELGIVQRREASTHAKLLDAERIANLSKPTSAQIAAIRGFASLPAITLVELGMTGPALELARWALELAGKKVLQTGANVVERAHRTGNASEG